MTAPDGDRFPQGCSNLLSNPCWRGCSTDNYPPSTDEYDASTAPRGAARPTRRIRGRGLRSLRRRLPLAERKPLLAHAGEASTTLPPL